jgi:hypothetical protein
MNSSDFKIILRNISCHSHHARNKVFRYMMQCGLSCNAGIRFLRNASKFPRASFSPSYANIGVARFLGVESQ